MNDLASRIASLPPEKRALLERRLLAETPGRISSGAIVRRGERESPLSFAQQRLWFLEQLDPGTALYNVPEALEIEGPLDVAALESALASIVTRHEVLRTSFGGDNGEPKARVEDVSIPLRITDLTAIPGDRLEGEAQAIAAEEAETPFDLRRAPLLRVRLVRLKPDLHWLLLTMHHIVCDEWSMGVLFSELSQLYRPGGQPSPDDLPPLPVQYADVAAWQRQTLQGPRLERDLSYWRGKLSGDLPMLSLPFDRPRPPLPSHGGAEHRRRLRPALTAALEGLSRREGATLFMTVLAAFDVLLSRYAGQEDVLVGTPIAGRLRRETECLVGFFVNTLVMRASLADDPPFRGLLRSVREDALEAFAHQELPFEKLVEELRPGRSLSHSPIFQVMFELDNAPGAITRARGTARDAGGARRREARNSISVCSPSTRKRVFSSSSSTRPTFSTRRRSPGWPPISRFSSRASSPIPTVWSRASPSSRSPSGVDSCTSGTARRLRRLPTRFRGCSRFAPRGRRRRRRSSTKARR